MKPRRSFVSVLAGIASAAPGVASANPPPPKILPDPPISAPSKDEAPTVVRKHEALCFAFYPSGGTLAVTCPTELIIEPLGQAILKTAAGRCQYVPFEKGGPGRTGFLDKCPPLFGEVAKAGVIPETTTQLIRAAAAARETHENDLAFDPPQPARLEAGGPQQVGCGGCATSARGDGDVLAVGTAVAIVAAQRRRRRR